MQNVTPQLLDAYLDDALGEADTALVEKSLRASTELRQTLHALMRDRDRGEHTVGAIWRRERISCPTRTQLGTYLLQALDEEHSEYIEFHLKIIGCAFCQANLADLASLQKEEQPDTQVRRRKFYESSAGLLRTR
jgi:DNA-binding phage protein